MQIAEKIENKIKQLTVLRNDLDRLGRVKVEQASIYEKELAKTIVKLNNGVEFELDGNKIKDPKTTVIEKIAKGLCWQDKYHMDNADIEYRNCLKKCEIIQAQLNAYQSINKYLKEI